MNKRSFFLCVGGDEQDNHARQNGGGIHIKEAGVVILRNSTISDCTADEDGGGVALFDLTVLGCEASIVRAKTNTKTKGRVLPMYIIHYPYFSKEKKMSRYKTIMLESWEELCMERQMSGFSWQIQLSVGIQGTTTGLHQFILGRPHT